MTSSQGVYATERLRFGRSRTCRSPPPAGRPLRRRRSAPSDGVRTIALPRMVSRQQVALSLRRLSKRNETCSWRLARLRWTAGRHLPSRSRAVFARRRRRRCVCPEAVASCGVVVAVAMTASPQEQPCRLRRTRCSFWAIPAAPDPAVGAVRRHRGTSIDAPRGLLLRAGR